MITENEISVPLIRRMSSRLLNLAVDMDRLLASCERSDITPADAADQLNDLISKITETINPPTQQ